MPDNGQRIGESFQVGDSVLFLCFDGFVIEGVSTLTCLEGGAWSTVTPTCTLPSMSGPRSAREGKGVVCYSDGFGT